MKTLSGSSTDNQSSFSSIHALAARSPGHSGRNRRTTSTRCHDQVGPIRVVKTKSKGKGNKRIRIEVLDA